MSKSPVEFLLDNYITNDIQNIFYPFRFLQILLISPKFRIKDNFIYPNEKRTNISLAVFFAVLFIIYMNKSIYNTAMAKIETFHILLIYFFYIYFFASVSVVFGYNILHGHNNVLLILTIQRIHLNINIGEKCTKYLILWNWICCLSTFFCCIMLTVCFYITYNSHTKTVYICVDYLIISVDLNLIYAIRIIILLKMYLSKFIDNNLLTDNLLHNFQKDFDIYQNCIQAYDLVKKIFHSLVIFHPFLEFILIKKYDDNVTIRFDFPFHKLG